jgi:hypothetical protein
MSESDALEMKAVERERWFARRLKIYREWARQPKDYGEDAGRAVEFAWAAGWDACEKALSSPPPAVGGEVEYRELLSRALAYLPDTLGITREIRAALTPQGGQKP